MKKQDLSVKVTLWVGRCVAVVLGAMLFLLPTIMELFANYRVMALWEKLLVTVSFYCCVVFIGWALWEMDRVLRNILSGQVFVRVNVRAVRHIQWCCGIVSLICVVATFGYLPLIFLAIIMAFLCLTVRVVVQAMDAAVTIREENDLTI